MELELTEKGLDCTYRIGNPNAANKDQDKFARCNTRKKVFVNKKRLKNTRISITESLTKDRTEFLKKAKNEFGFNNVWKVDGLICYYDEVAKKDQVYFDFNGPVFFPHEASNTCGVLIVYLGKTSFSIINKKPIKLRECWFLMLC